jgi:hypothetical protein
VEPLADIMNVNEFVDFECNCHNQYELYQKFGVWPAETLEHCKVFMACLNDQRSISGRVVLGVAAALQKYSEVTLAQTPAMNGQSSDSNCFTPSDAEYGTLVQCGCLGGLVTACGDEIGPIDSCLHDYACLKDNVCEEWKGLNCGHLPQSALQLRAGRVQQDANGDTDQLNRSAAGTRSGLRSRDLAFAQSALQLRAGRVEKDANGDTDQPNRSTAGTRSGLHSRKLVLETTLCSKQAF